MDEHVLNFNAICTSLEMELRACHKQEYREIFPSQKPDSEYIHSFRSVEFF